MADTYGSLRGLKKRSQFLRAGKGRRAGQQALGLQMIPTPDTDHEETPGIGLTVTKRVGNSPERNRIKRRLRAAVRACQSQFHPQHDYVLVGRRAALDVPFEQLVSGLGTLIERVHKPNTENQNKRTR